MNKVRLRSRVVLFLLTILFVFNTFSICVLAERSAVDSVSYIIENQAGISAICAKANDVVGNEILVYTGNDGLLSFSNKMYNEMEMDEKRDFMETALMSTKESGLGSQVKNKVYNFIADQDSTTSAAIKYLRSDASADFVSASAWFKPFSGAFGTIMGVICLLIFLFMGMSVLFDIAYLVLPGFQGLLERGESHKRPVGVSREAWISLQEVEKEPEYQNVLTLYFKKRIGIMFIIALALGYIISGKIYDMIVYLIDALNSI